MHTIITKWTKTYPEENGLWGNIRYLRYPEIENILTKDNLEDGVPIVPSDKYDATIYRSWLTALGQYRNYFMANAPTMEYQFFQQNPGGTIITVQTFESEEIHSAVTTESFYPDFVAARQNFNDLIGVSVEIKKTNALLATLDSYEAADAVFVTL